MSQQGAGQGEPEGKQRAERAPACRTAPDERKHEAKMAARNERNQQNKGSMNSFGWRKHGPPRAGAA